MTTNTKVPTEREVLDYFNTLSNWGRWGRDDQMGTLNLITPEKRVQAARLVQRGVTVGCARPVSKDMSSDIDYPPPLHFMLESGEGWVTPSGAERGPRQVASDFFGMRFHGITVTHIDALSHVFWEGKLYNDHPAEAVATGQGATVHSISTLKDGVVTRGVVLDIPRLKGKEWLDPGEAVFPEDLEAAEAAQGVRVEEGDALCLRLGWYTRRNRVGPAPREVGRPGLHASTLPWLHRRGVALIAADAAHDVSPSGYEKLDIPVHQVGIVAMGLWLVDNANFDDLVEQCQALGRWEFLFTLAPVRFIGMTGSPLTPLATF
jgi:kynurenine formamidase